MELRASPVPPLDCERPVGRDVAGAGRGWRRHHVANGRQHHRAGAPLRRRRKRGTQNQALGRSRGWFSTKIHLRTNAEGLPIGILLTPGEAHDSTAYVDLMAECDADPDVLLADRGYDSDAIRDDVRHQADRLKSRPSGTVTYSIRSMAPSMQCGLASSSSSASLRTAGASRPATIIPQAVSLASSCLQPSGSGSSLSTRPSISSP